MTGIHSCNSLNACLSLIVFFSLSLKSTIWHENKKAICNAYKPWEDDNFKIWGPIYSRISLRKILFSQLTLILLQTMSFDESFPLTLFWYTNHTSVCTTVTWFRSFANPLLTLISLLIIIIRTILDFTHVIGSHVFF